MLSRLEKATSEIEELKQTTFCFIVILDPCGAFFVYISIVFR